MTPTNVWLRDPVSPGERLAVVALPCQVHALRALQRRGHPKLEAMRLLVGLYCGNQLYFGATRSFLSRNGVRDLSEVVAIHYRDGTWPGSVRCELATGRSASVPKFHFNHLISFYVIERCLLCADLAAEGADLSVGDAWDPPHPDSCGWSLVVSRSELGEGVVRDALRRDVLHADEVSLDHALRMHAHALDLKKTGALLRIEKLAAKGKPAPQYDLPPPDAPLRRRLTEALVRAHFALGRTRTARWLVDRVPFAWIGRLYNVARLVWKRRASRTARA